MKPPKGWRWVKSGEIVRRGDVFNYPLADRYPTTSSSTLTFIRRIAKPKSKARKK